MKKKLLTFILMITAMFTGVVGLTACKEGPTTPPQGPAQSSNDMGNESTHTHTYTSTTKQPTCAEKGLTTYTCACGDSYTEEIPATGVHTWDDGVETTAPTCAKEGVTTYTCACGDSYTEEIPALGHDEKNHEAQAPTCTEIGWEEYVTCEREGCDYSTYKEISATGVHTWDDGVETTAPTCAKEGVTTYTCTVCEKETKTEPIDKLPHEHSAEWSSNVTHHWHECECGDKKDEAEHTAGAPATATTPQTCTVCGYILQVETGILFNTLTVNDMKVYGKVSNDTTEFSFINEVTVKGNATYVVDNDKDCGSPIYSKTVDLAIGDNTFYVLEMIGNDIKLYTITIRRRPMYEVTFNTNGGTSVEKQVIEEDFLATEPETTRAGYTFSGWNYDFATPITENTKITATWSANTDTKYIVSYYLQNLDDDEYTLHETVELTGETDTTATAIVKAYDHFTFNASANTTSGNIDGNGTLVLSVYYTRDSYSIIANNNNAKAGTSTQINGTYKYDKEFTLTATTNAGYTWLGWYDGETLACETEEFTFKAEKDVTYTATWSANTDTKYTVNYYLQNIEDNNYTLHETVELKGETDTTAKAEIKEYTHFTYNASKSTITGNINPTGSRVLSVYYTRDSYSIIANNNNAKAGTVAGSGTYRFDKEITLTATTNAGYTWLGWYDGENLACETETFTFKAEKDVTYTATWSANTDTKYTVNYYLQNLDDSNYTLHETVELTGETDTPTAKVDIREYAHFTYNASMSVISGNIDGNGNQVLKVYYTRNTYTLSVENTSTGAITNSGIYKYGKELSTTATPCLGYEFVGWYSGETLLSTDLTYTFTVTQNVTAKFEVKAEMSNFNFTSTATTCSIMGVKDKTVTEIVVPDYVTSISNGAFRGCSRLTEITLPFVGATNDTNFGRIFGTSSYTGGTATTQYYYGSITTISTYYIPTSLKKVTITGDSIGDCMFYNCSSLTSIVIPDSVTSIGNYAFDGCSRLTSIEIPDSVTSIGKNAFSGCSSLTEITLPFVGETKDGTSNTHFGYIFGASSYSNNDNYVPTSLKKVTITGGNILYSAFRGCSSLTSIIIPDSVTSIGNYAFYGCSSLTSVVIPDSVTSIGAGAFWVCSSLTSVVIGDGVTSIGYDAFEYCSRLTNIIVSENNAVYEAIDGNLYTKDGKNLIQYARGKTAKSFIIPDSVTSIGAGAFFGCDGLTSIEIPDSVTSIGRSAFSCCDSLTSIEIPDSVTSIGYEAFYGCSSLTEITLPFVGETKDGTSNTHFGYIFGAISYSNNDNYVPTSLKKVTITGGNILYGAFDGCSSLTSIVIPDSVTSIGNYAFSGCSSLTSITVLDGNTAYKDIDGNLYSKDGTTLIQYAIGKTAKSFIIPDSVTSIGAGAFSGCDSLTSIEIPDSVTSIGVGAFRYCDSLTSIEIPDSVTSIGYEAFSGCSSLTSIEIPDSVTSIGAGAFSGCDSLTEITLPFVGETKDGTSNTHFGYIFGTSSYSYNNDYVPTSLKKVTVTGGSIGSYAFEYCSSLTSVILGDGVTSIGSYAFYACRSLIGITIPSGVTSIGAYAFEYCSSLTSITFKDTSTWYRTTNSSKWENKTGGTKTTVTAPSDNATYFKETYYDYYWYKL